MWTASGTWQKHFICEHFRALHVAGGAQDCRWQRFTINGELGHVLLFNASACDVQPRSTTLVVRKNHYGHGAK